MDGLPGWAGWVAGLALPPSTCQMGAAMHPPRALKGGSSLTAHCEIPGCCLQLEGVRVDRWTFRLLMFAALNARPGLQFDLLMRVLGEARWVRNDVALHFAC